MKIKLLQYSPISLAIIGARVCYDSFQNSDTKMLYKKEYSLTNNEVNPSLLYELKYFKINDENPFGIENGKLEMIGEKDKELIQRLITLGHESVIEHVVYSFYINGISRAILQQLVRHRIASYSVESTRYVLKKIVKKIKTLDDVDNFVVYAPNIPYELQKQHAFERLFTIKQLAKHFKNDDLKYLLPENLKTKLVWTVNARELRHFLKLRLDKKAHWEIRELAKNIYEVLPQKHKEILFFDIEVENEKTKGIN